jgi:hypothetical protein
MSIRQGFRVCAIIVELTPHTDDRSTFGCPVTLGVELTSPEAVPVLARALRDEEPLIRVHAA